MNPPTVVNITAASLRKSGYSYDPAFDETPLKKSNYNLLYQWIRDPTHVLCVRTLQFLNHALVKEHQPLFQVLGNPFRLSKDQTREQVIQKFEEYIRARPSLLEQVDKLSGCQLGCVCHPQACHCDVLVKIWKERHESV